VYEVTRPKAHSTTRRTAAVHNMIDCLPSEAASLHVVCRRRIHAGWAAQIRDLQRGRVFSWHMRWRQFTSNRHHRNRPHKTQLDGSTRQRDRPPVAVQGWNLVAEEPAHSE